LQEQEFDISHVYFVSIVEHDYTTETPETDAVRSLSEIRAGVESRMRELANGSYTRSPRPGGTGEVVEIGSAAAGLYKRCLSALEEMETTSVTFRWSELDDRLATYSEDGRGVFDVTALKNNLLVDIVIGLLSRGSNRIYAFEILKQGKRSYDERELVHNLQKGGNLARGDYVYRNLLQNPNVKTALGRIISHSVRFRSLVIITGIVGIVVVLIQIFYPNSWPETVVAVLAAVAAIAAWLYSLNFG
jgi:hypothetical protein